MGIFKKNKIEFEDSGERTPVKFREKGERAKNLDPENKKKKRKKLKRIIFATIFVLLIGFGAIFGLKGYRSIKKIFEGESGILNLLTGSQNKPLRGESEGRVNFLLLGVGDKDHEGATLSDTVIIVSYDTNKKSVAMFSLPRDLYVKIPKYGYAKINAAHAYGEQYKYPGGGPALAKKTVEENFGIPIHYYARVDFSGLAKIVDTLGGVTVDVERSFCDYNYPVERKGDTSKVCFNAGSQTMNGTKALQYSRSRHAQGPEGSDFARSKRQQKLILAIKDKGLSLNTVFNPKKVLEIMGVLGDHMKTDLGVGELGRIYELSKEIDNSKILTKNFDNSPEGMLVSSSSSAGYILQPQNGDFTEISEYIKNIFAFSGIKNENAKIGLYNGTYTAIKSLGDKMKADGYNVVTVENATSRNLTKTEIIDNTNGAKPETIKALENKFGVKAVTGNSGGATVEIKVIIGRDYKGL